MRKSTKMLLFFTGLFALTGNWKALKNTWMVYISFVVIGTILGVIAVIYMYVTGIKRQKEAEAERIEMVAARQQEEQRQLAIEAERQTEAEIQEKEHMAKLQKKKEAVASAFKAEFGGQSFQSWGLPSSPTSDLEYWRITFTKNHKIKFESQMVPRNSKPAAEDWRYVKDVPYEFIVDLDESRYCFPEFKGHCILKCDGFEAEINVFNDFQEPLRFSDSFRFEGKGKSFGFHKVNS